MKTESKIRTFGITAILISSFYLMAYVKDNEFKTVNQAQEQFVNGQVLYPDYVIQDTMVIINASFMNECMDKDMFKSDGDIYEIIQESCVNIADYEDYIKAIAKK